MPDQHSDRDWQKLAEEAQASNLALSNIVRVYTEELENFDKKRKESEHDLEQAEERLKDAEQRADEAGALYKKAIALKDGQYEQLIKDLFQTPKENLEHSIKAQSGRSILVTMIVAIIHCHKLGDDGLVGKQEQPPRCEYYGEGFRRNESLP